MQRHMGLFQATLVGLGGIVGGGILALAGVALASTGPSALLAFALNAVLAILTAMSFAEMATSFPQSGGAYTYAKKVLPVQSAFAVGWVVWFASVVAGALYALGFAAYARLAVSTFRPDWIFPGLETLLAGLAVLLYSVLQIRPGKSGGQLETVGKMILFVLIIVGGLTAATTDPVHSLIPFFANGSSGLFQAMGFSFMAFQGFDLIAAVAGEVKEPRKNLPRAMIGSLVAAVTIYVPLLLVIALFGVPQGQTLVDFATLHPETLVALSAEQFMGKTGYWLVVVAAILAMLSALQANLLASTSMAQAMAGDRTLPFQLMSTQNSLVTSAGMMLVLVTVIPDVGTAGAAAGLVFLLSFALVHWCCLLARQRSSGLNVGYQVPGFPMVPRIAGLCCLALAFFQGYMVPAAGVILAVWLTVGAGLFLTLLTKKARVSDAAKEASDPELVRMRGRSPLVLVPVVNPESVTSMMTLANALSPPAVGRVVLLSVVPTLGQVESTQQLIGETLEISLAQGLRPELLITLADDPWKEIARVCKIHSCESILLGFGGSEAGEGLAFLEKVTKAVRCDVVIVRAGRQWSFSKSQRILVPVAGLGANDALRARILNSLIRLGDREIQYLNLLPQESTEKEIKLAEQRLSRLALDEVQAKAKIVVRTSENVIEDLIAEADNFDLVVLGLRSGAELLGDVVLEVAKRSQTAMVVLGRHR